MATYRPDIDQSQHAKSVSHIINCVICGNLQIMWSDGIFD